MIDAIQAFCILVIPQAVLFNHHKQAVIYHLIEEIRAFKNRREGRRIHNAAAHHLCLSANAKSHGALLLNECVMQITTDTTPACCHEFAYENMTFFIDGSLRTYAINKIVDDVLVGRDFLRVSAGIVLKVNIPSL